MLTEGMISYTTIGRLKELLEELKEMGASDDMPVVVDIPLHDRNCGLCEDTYYIQTGITKSLFSCDDVVIASIIEMNTDSTYQGEKE